MTFFFIQHALILAGIFAGVATAWALFAGFGGQFSFGNAALFGLPAYGAVLGNQYWHLPPFLGLVLFAGLTSAVSLALVAPALRLKGPYFALLTLAAAEIARRMINEARDVTGGDGGKVFSTDQTGLLFLTPGNDSEYMIWTTLFAALCVLVCWLTVRSRAGVRLIAVRDDEEVAQSVGISPTSTRALAFVITAFLTGIGGGLYAYSARILSSDALLGTVISVNILVFAAVGGLRSHVGPAVGAILLVIADQALRQRFGGDNPTLYPAVYTLVFLLVLFAAPEGIVPFVRRLAMRGSADQNWAGWGYRKRRLTNAQRQDDQTLAADTAALRELLARLDTLRRRPTVQSAGGEHLLQTVSLSKRFGAITATDGTNLVVAEGARVGIWGPNGSGKSTFMNLLAGQLISDSGRILLDGRPIEHAPPQVRARFGVARTFQQARVFESQTPVANLFPSLVASTKLNLLWPTDRAVATDLAHLALRSVGLPPRVASQAASALSTGQRKRLELARVLVGIPPRILLLDEPTAGIDRDGVPALAELLNALHSVMGMALVVVDHDAAFIRSVTETVHLLVRGQIVRSIDSHARTFDTDLAEFVSRGAPRPRMATL